MQVEVYHFDDWVNIIIDGKSWFSGHSLSRREFVQFLTDVFGLQIMEREVSLGEDGCDPLMDANTKEPLPDLEARYPFLGTHPEPHEQWSKG